MMIPKSLETDRRTKNTLKDWAVIITLSLNLAGLIWTAAKWSSTIETLSTTQLHQSIILDNAVAKLNNIDTRLTVVEYQLNCCKLNTNKK